MLVIFISKKCVRVTLFYQLHEQEQKQHPMKINIKRMNHFMEFICNTIELLT